MTTQPSELDSIGYHIPIAESVLDGSVFYPNYTSFYSYYPGTGEAVLAVLMAMGFPANMFNVIGVGILFGVMKKLGEQEGLPRDEAIILAVSMALLPTVLRLPLTQLVDIWLAIWWGWWLILITRPMSTKKWQLIFGLVSGLLMGTKISGIMLFITGMVFWGKNIKKWTFLWVTIIVGGFWYARNWVVTGNPFYPLDVWIWSGHPLAKLPIVWKFLVFEKGWGRFLEACVSEFLGWSTALLAVIKFRNRWLGLGLVNFLLFLLMPGSPGTIVSNCRYLIPAIMTLALGLWIEVKKLKRQDTLAVLAVVNSMMVLPQLEYRPKIILVSLIIIGIYNFKFFKQ